MPGPMTACRRAFPKCNVSLFSPPLEAVFVKLSCSWAEKIVIGPSVACGDSLEVSRRRLSLLDEEIGSERPVAVKGAPLGAAERTLDGEDRSEILLQEGKAQVGYFAFCVHEGVSYPNSQCNPVVRKSERVRESRRNFREKMHGKDCDLLHRKRQPADNWNAEASKSPTRAPLLRPTQD